MRNRGLTLLEMLLAMALLSAIVAATASWMQIAAGLVSPTGETARQQWIGAAESALELIDHDLQTGDFEAHDTQPADNTEPKAFVVDNQLAIRVRASDLTSRSHLTGVALHEYRLDSAQAQLQLVERTGTEANTRGLLDGVQAWQCQMDQERRFFQVSLAGIYGSTLTRRYCLP